MYFKSSDRLFTTTHVFQWKDEDMLKISGVSAVALLLRSRCAVEYLDPEVFAEFF